MREAVPAERLELSLAAPETWCLCRLGYAGPVGQRTGRASPAPAGARQVVGVVGIVVSGAVRDWYQRGPPGQHGMSCGCSRPLASRPQTRWPRSSDSLRSTAVIACGLSGEPSTALATLVTRSEIWVTSERISVGAERFSLMNCSAGASCLASDGRRVVRLQAGEDLGQALTSAGAPCRRSPWWAWPSCNQAISADTARTTTAVRRIAPSITR